MPLVLKIYSDSTQARLTSCLRIGVGRADRVRLGPNRERRGKPGLDRALLTRLPIASPVGFFALMNIIYFDLETQRTANDVGGWDRKRDMGMSLGVTYSTILSEYRIFPENRVNDLIQQLLRADLVVGFNIVSFDYEVLMGYTILDLPHQLRTLDLLRRDREGGGEQA